MLGAMQGESQDSCVQKQAGIPQGSVEARRFV